MTTTLLDTQPTKTTKKKIYTRDEVFKASLEYFQNHNIAADIFTEKYALRDDKDNFVELTPDDMHWRLANEFSRIEKNKFKKPLSAEFIYSLLKNFSKIIPQGSPMYGIGNTYQYVSTSNCFVIESPDDSYGGICKYDEELVQISKRRGGVGGDISTLRPNKAPTKNSSRTSTGIIPFAKRFSNSIREVGQDGRRGAEMITLSVHHPEAVIPWDNEIDGTPYNVEINDKDLGHFLVSSKNYNPKKVDFTTCKYDRTNVTGANISLRISDEFMEAAISNKNYEQRWPVDQKPKIKKSVSASKCWDKITHSAWQTAEPGVLFWDTIIRESVADCYAEHGFKTIATNPCGEIPLPKYDSCRLLINNLFAFVKNPFTKDAYFDFNEFYESAKISQRLMDDLVDLEIEAVQKILDKINDDPENAAIKAREKYLWEQVLYMAKTGRRTGTGITALGDTLAALNIKYGSDESIKTTEDIYRTLKFACYQSSVDMAKELGPFPIWNHALEKNNPFINRIKNETVVLNGYNADGTCLDDEKDKTITVLNGHHIWSAMKEYGRRNIALLTTAPAGSVSQLTKLINRYDTSSGIEPRFMVKPYIRRRKITHSEKDVKVDFVDQTGDSWQNYEVPQMAVQEWMDATGETDITKSPWYGSCAEDIDWLQRVKLQAAAQKHVDHSISSTINLPEDVTPEKVREIYETAWKSGCKGMTVYRKNCRTGVLIEKTKDTAFGLPKTQPPKRPSDLPCDIHHIKVSKKLDKLRTFEYIVAVGLFNGEPYEVFAFENGKLDKKYTKGILRKMSRGRYSIILEDDTSLDNITQHTTEDEDAITRLTSTSLRHGSNIAFIVQQLEKVDGDNLGSFIKSVSRALKKYIKDGTAIVGENCPQCNKQSLVREGGCPICKECGWTKC